jgi:hypothetical protein
MSQKPPPPYCLSRQHPELAKRSPAPREPIGARRETPPPASPRRPEGPAGKSL